MGSSGSQSSPRVSVVAFDKLLHCPLLSLPHTVIPPGGLHPAGTSASVFRSHVHRLYLNIKSSEGQTYTNASAKHLLCVFLMARTCGFGIRFSKNLKQQRSGGTKPIPEAMRGPTGHFSARRRVATSTSSMSNNYGNK